MTNSSENHTATTLVLPPTNDIDSSNTTSSHRRLSQHITDIVAGVAPVRSRSGSSPRSPSPNSLENGSNRLTVEFESGPHVIVRPNQTVRGVVKLVVTKPIHASQIRMRFRCEEVATVKVREHGLESKFERIDQVITTLFDVTTKVWGNEPAAYLMSAWEIIEPGEHEYPFALKFPNVNFPPSTDDIPGFSVHYIWSAHVDGPSCHLGARSKEYIMPYRPIICAPQPKEWIFTQTCSSADKKSPIANITATLPRRAFCPDENVEMELQISSIPSDMVVSKVSFSLNKCSVGQLQIQRGLTRKARTRKILQSDSTVSGNAGSVKIPIKFHVPTRLVSPSFQSRHHCVYYELVFHLQFVCHGTFVKSSVSSAEFSVPIGITNLPNSHMLHIPNLTSVQSYMQSKESPIFFDPSLDEPPAGNRFPSELWGPLTAALATPPVTSPPNYFSLPSLPAQFIQRDREEKSIFTSRLVKPGMVPELGDPVVVIADHKDYEW